MKDEYVYVMLSLMIVSFLIGCVLGAYITFPENITVDVGDNYIEVIDRMEKLNLTIDNKNCPDCICN